MVVSEFFKQCAFGQNLLDKFICAVVSLGQHIELCPNASKAIVHKNSTAMLSFLAG